MTLRVTSLLTACALALGAGGPALSAERVCAGRPCIAVGTWNIKLLGAGIDPYGAARDFTGLVERIAPLDVVVLQEIDIDETRAWGTLRPMLESEGFAVAAQGGFGGGAPERQQHVVIMIRPAHVAAVPDSAGDFAIPTTTPDLGNGCESYDSVRPPVSVRLQAGDLDFRLIGVHLKSRRPLAPFGSCDDDIRAFQARSIIEEAAALAEADGETDVVIAGDINSPFDEPEFRALRDAGLVTLLPASCAPATLAGCTYIGSRPGTIDHVIVPQAMAGTVAGAAVIGAPGDAARYGDTLSDHLPVWAEFRIDLN